MDNNVLAAIMIIEIHLNGRHQQNNEQKKKFSPHSNSSFSWRFIASSLAKRVSAASSRAVLLYAIIAQSVMERYMLFVISTSP
jgi:hypothetical protein